MMFLKNNLLAEVAGKLYIYKLKGNIQVFVSLIAVQFIAVFFSLNGVGGSGSGAGNISIDIKMFSGEIVWGMTLIWILAITFGMTTEGARNIDFSFTASRLSSNLASIFFLVTVSFISSISLLLYNFITRDAVVLLNRQNYYVADSFRITPDQILIGILSAFLYFLLFSSLIYLYGVLTQLSKPLFVIAPSIVIGFAIYENKNNSQNNVFTAIYNCFFQESNLLIFTVKCIFSAALLFAISLSISDRLEVRK